VDHQNRRFSYVHPADLPRNDGHGPITNSKPGACVWHAKPYFLETLFSTCSEMHTAYVLGHVTQICAAHLMLCIVLHRIRNSNWCCLCSHSNCRHGECSDLVYSQRPRPEECLKSWPGHTADTTRSCPGALMLDMPSNTKAGRMLLTPLYAQCASPHLSP